MKIVVVQENLKNALAVCSRAVASSSTLAILGSVLLKTQNGLLKISATNLEIGISQEVRCKVDLEGSVCLPAKLFSEVVGNLPEGPVVLETVSEGLRLSVGKYKTVLKVLQPEDFPVIGDVVPTKTLRVSSGELHRNLERVAFAASVNETQTELCGVYWAVKDGVLILTATDRYRLAESRLTLDKNKAGDDFSIIIPSRAVQELLRLAHAASGEVVVGFTENQAVFISDGTIITTRLVDAQYPEYEAIVPKDFSVSVLVKKNEFASALKAVAVFARGTNGVAVKYQDGTGLVVSARSQDAGEGEVEVEAKVLGGTDTVLFNHKYLLDMFQYVSAEAVEWRLNGPTTPVVFTGQGDGLYRYLVMPIKA